MGSDYIQDWIEQGDGYVETSTTVGIQFLRAVSQSITIGQLPTLLKHNKLFHCCHRSEGMIKIQPVKNIGWLVFI